MSTRHPTPDTTARTFHPRALAALGAQSCIAMLSVARDLRSGAIALEQYDQSTYCGTACCIAGHTAFRLGEDQGTWLGRIGRKGCPGFLDLVNGGHPSDPQLAARAIERYLYEGAEQPWAGAP